MAGALLTLVGLALLVMSLGSVTPLLNSGAVTLLGVFVFGAGLAAFCFATLHKEEIAKPVAVKFQHDSLGDGVYSNELSFPVTRMKNHPTLPQHTDTGGGRADRTA